MNTQELLQAAKEIREICRNAVSITGTWEDCKKCPFYASPCIFIEYEDGQEAYPPNSWEIERAENKHLMLDNWINRLDDEEATELTQVEQGELKRMLIELRECKKFDERE
jgi:hypothetical protein